MYKHARTHLRVHTRTYKHTHTIEIPRMHILTRRRTHIKTHTHPKKQPYTLQTPRYTYIEKCMCMDGVCVRECVFINTHTHTYATIHKRTRIRTRMRKHSHPHLGKYTYHILCRQERCSNTFLIQRCEKHVTSRCTSSTRPVATWPIAGLSDRP